jgi:basic membrane lipoprotein Med (substrate-binding protein (PBP1-ABC) superfamily)
MPARMLHGLIRCPRLPAVPPAPIVLVVQIVSIGPQAPNRPVSTSAAPTHPIEEFSAMSSLRRPVLATLAAAALLAVAGPSFAQAKLKVAAIYTVPVEQQWVSRIDKALKAAAARGEIEYEFSEKVANADYERVMRQYAEKGNTLIVGESFAVEAAARKVAKEYPKVSFLMGSSGKPQAPNFSVFDNYIQEPAYLSGLIAGAMSKSGKIGMVGGYSIPEVNRLMNAFMAGAKETNPKVTFMVTFINSWFDPPKAKEAAFAMIDKGADVMYAERFGVSDAAKERKVLAIGNVINTQKDYPETVVASALWNMEPTIDRALKAVKEGKFKAEDYGQYSMMKFKGSELSPLGTFEGKVPKAVMDKVAQRQKEILEGKFTVKIDDNAPKATAK